MTTFVTVIFIASIISLLGDMIRIGLFVAGELQDSNGITLVASIFEHLLFIIWGGILLF